MLALVSVRGGQNHMRENSTQTLFGAAMYDDHFEHRVGKRFSGLLPVCC
jgi:hypothetical protein